MKKSIYRLPVLIFAATAVVICIVNLALPDKNYSENENRYLQLLPSPSVSSIRNGEFEKTFQNYIDDQLTLRDTLMKVKSAITAMTGSREVNGVYIGNDGRLFEAIKPWEVNEDLIDKNIASTESFFKRCGLDKDRCSVMIVPTAGYVCAGHLPSLAPMVNQEKILDDISAKLASATVTNVSETLVKADFLQFYLTDHHWTSDAAYASYKLWRTEKPTYDSYKRKTVTSDFQGTLYSKVLFTDKRDSIHIFDSGKDFIADCDGKTKNLFDISALEEKDKYKVFLGGNYSEVMLKGNGTGSLLIIKDSFANAFTQFAVNDYAEVRLLDLRYYNGNVVQYMTNNKITEVLVLYSLNTFISDRNIVKLSSSM